MDCKVGDVIGMIRFHNGTLMTAKIVTVETINRWGHIMVTGGRVFDKSGNERNARGQSYNSGAWLCTEERVRAEQAAHEVYIARRKAVNEIEAIIRANGDNRFPLRDETKARLIELVGAL